MPFSFPSIEDAGDLRGKRIFLTIDFNLAIKDDIVIDEYRVKRSARTLAYLQSQGARSLMVAHRTDETASLYPVFELLKKAYPIVFARTIDEARTALSEAKEGTFVLLENIRKIAGKKEIANDTGFAKELASLADVYINERFSVSHREHASIVGVPKFLPHFAGFLFIDEVKHLSKAFKPQKPFFFLLAGAKFDTKLPLVNKFLKIADSVFIGGALANDLFKEKGFEIGQSKRSNGNYNFSDIVADPKLILPNDVVVDGSNGRLVKDVSEVNTGDSIFDAGPKTIESLKKQFTSAKFILWNGTLGAYEHGFAEGTEMLARAIAESNVESIIGGGDTLACVSKLNLLDRFSFVSTGGGAMLDFLANETLPGIVALEKKFEPNR